MTQSQQLEQIIQTLYGTSLPSFLPSPSGAGPMHTEWLAGILDIQLRQLMSSSTEKNVSVRARVLAGLRVARSLRREDPGVQLALTLDRIKLLSILPQLSLWRRYQLRHWWSDRIVPPYLASASGTPEATYRPATSGLRRMSYAEFLSTQTAQVAKSQSARTPCTTPPSRSSPSTPSTS